MTTAAANGIKGFSISLLLHLVAAAFFLNLSQSKSVAQEELEKPLILSLKSFELPAASKPQKNEIPKEVVQKQEVQKTVKKSVEKTTVRNRAVQSAEPVQETPPQETPKPLQEAFVAETKETAPTQNDTLSTAEQKIAPNEEELQSEFIKTNFQSIREKVLANLKYPNSARRMGITGCAEVTLIIDPSGKLLDVVLEKSSGHEVLDKSALQAAGELSTQALPTPQMISRVTLPIRFALN